MIFVSEEHTAPIFRVEPLLPFPLCSSGLWHCVVWGVVTNASDERNAFIFTIKVYIVPHILVYTASQTVRLHHETDLWLQNIAVTYNLGFQTGFWVGYRLSNKRGTLYHALVLFFLVISGCQDGDVTATAVLPDHCGGLGGSPQPRHSCDLARAAHVTSGIHTHTHAPLTREFWSELSGMLLFLSAGRLQGARPLKSS